MTHQKAGEKLRQCIGCHAQRRKDDLIRVIRTPEGLVEIDRTGKKNGRGAYLCADNPSCLEEALKHKSLERALKVPVPEELAATLKEAYTRGQQT